VVATLGRLDVLQENGQIDSLISSCGRFSDQVAVVEAHREGRTRPAQQVCIGPTLVFERLWQELGLPQILGRFLKDRRYEFDVERAVFLTVLHRLFPSGSDRAAERWRRDHSIPGVAELELHHLYRAMAWLGEALPQDDQSGASPFAPRCTKDLIEEALRHCHDLRDVDRRDAGELLDQRALELRGARGRLAVRQQHVELRRRLEEGAPERHEHLEAEADERLRGFRDRGTLPPLRAHAGNGLGIDGRRFGAVPLAG
jgi:hypothetical protein